MRSIFLIAILGITSLGFSYDATPLNVELEVAVDWSDTVDQKLKDICQEIERLKSIQQNVFNLLQDAMKPETEINE